MNKITRPRLGTFMTTVSATLVVAIAAACSGGGGSTGAPAVAPIPSSSPAAQSLTNASFRFEIPSTSSTSAKRAPKYVSAATQSITIALQTVNGAAPSPVVPSQTINVSNCPADPSNPGNSVCTVMYPVPGAASPGDLDGVEISTFDAPAGGGHLLSQQTIASYVILGQTNNLPFTLDANPQNTTLSVTAPSDGNVTGTQAGGYTLAATAGAEQFPFALTDAGGSTIVGPGLPAYSASISPATGVATVSVSGQTLTITPAGAGGTATVTLTATGANASDGLSPNSFTFHVTTSGATPTPSPSPSPTVQPTVQAVADGGFEAGGAAGGYNYPTNPHDWYACYAARVMQSPVPVNASPTPYPDSATQAPGGPTTAPVASDNALRTGVVTGNPIPTASAPATTAPENGAVHDGTYAMLVGHSTSLSRGKYVHGVCQNVTIPAYSASLTFWVYEGGNLIYYDADDTEVSLYNSTDFATAYASFTPGIGGTAYETAAAVAPQTTLLSELNCYDEGLAYSTAAGVMECRPTNTPNAANGNHWYQKTIAIPSQYAGLNMTLFMGIYGSSSSTTYHYFTYFDDVSLTGYATNPASAKRKPSAAIR